MQARTIRAFLSNATLCVLFSVLILLISCSGSGNPVTPDPGQTPGLSEPVVSTGNARKPEGIMNHYPGGMYTMIIDQETHEIEVVENRELAMHMDVKAILQSNWWCPAHNCINIQFLDIDTVNNIYTIKGTLVNPSWFTGNDVRVIIFYDDKGHDLLNADDFTMLYEDEDDINPFRAYAKTVDNREFSAFASFSEIFEMYIPPVPHKFMINFAVDASFPGNCEEPYDIENFGYEGSIYPDDPDLDGIDQGEGTVYTEVYDWQDNISEVSVDTTPITGDITPLVYNSDLDRWEASITDSEDAAPGEYRCLIAAFSEDDQDIGLYNYVTITVDETPPPAVQTIYGNVADSFFLDGVPAVISVVNQDPLGFQPEPLSTVTGEYLVQVTTGTFNISVAPNDLTHNSCVVWDVIVTTDEDIPIDLLLNDPTQEDPYDWYDQVNWNYITGFAGRVMDELGMPIPNATIEIKSPDSWAMQEGQDFVQCAVTDENGYFNLLNMVVMEDEFSGQISNYHIYVRAEGYEVVDMGLFPDLIDQVQYMVIPMVTLAPQTPIFTESFEEEDSGWTYTGYYHRQLYDPGIVNLSFDPANNFVVMPPDEAYGGAIPPPTDGDHYLWYGVTSDGNFIGIWADYNEQYGGGISDMAHSGSATSPPIDLTGYTSAWVEFDLSFDIESQIPSNYDEMRFYVVSGGSSYLQQFYNPFADPGPREYTVTQKGYNRTMIWCHYVYDLSAYVDTEVSLRFDFETGDTQYNGCRGEFIDNIKLYAQ